MEYVALFVFVAAGTAINFLITDAVKGSSPFRMSALRLIVGGAVAIAIGGSNHAGAPNLYELVRLAISGVLLFAAGQSLIFLAQKARGAKAIDVAVVEAALPVPIYIFSLREFSLGPGQWASVAGLELLAVVGLLVFMGLDPWRGASHRKGQYLLLLASALVTSAGICFLYQPGSSSGFSWTALWDTFVATGVMALAGGLTSLLVWNVRVDREDPPPSVFWLRVSVLALVGVVVGWTPLVLLRNSPNRFVLVGIGLTLIPLITLLITAWTEASSLAAKRGPVSWDHRYLGAGLVIFACGGLVFLLSRP